MRRWAWLLSLLLAGNLCAAEAPELRGAWVWGVTCGSREKADTILKRAEAMHLNALYVLVFYWNGTAAWRSDLIPTTPGIEPGFDPLGYLVQQGKAKGIDIHAWFVNGSTRGAPDTPWFKAHPNWRARNMAGAPIDWFDLLQPDVRAMEADLMLEVARKYDVAGVHFDYIRFPDQNVSSTDALNAEAMKTLGGTWEDLAAATLPVDGRFGGNPLAQPTAARVLATFDDGEPAIAITPLGAGRTALFNFQAQSVSLPVIDTVALRLNAQLGAKPGDPVYVLNSDLNATKYERRFYEAGREWARRLGFKPKELKDDLAGLPDKAVVWLVGDYLLTPEQAAKLVTHAKAGGGCLIVDGPVINFGKAPAYAELTGFAATGRFFSKERTLVPAPGSDDLVPAGPAPKPKAERKRLQDGWDQWRKDQVTDLVTTVSKRAKTEAPGKQVTAAVFHTLDSADAVLQDWPRWVRERLVDYVIPMSYVPTPQVLQANLREYKTIDPTLARIIPAIGTTTLGKGVTPDEQVNRIAAQIRVCRQEQAHGFVFFSLEGMSDEVARRLGAGELAGTAKVYAPPPR